MPSVVAGYAYANGYTPGRGAPGPAPGFDRRSVISDLWDDAYWDAFEYREQRYRLLWALYENNAYSPGHDWSWPYQRAYDMYAHTRSLTGVPTRVGEFHALHTMPGPLDPAAGDGKVVPSALPIVLPKEDPAVRAAIGRLWRDSNWQVFKTLLCRYGAVLGDAAIQVLDDPSRGKVYIRPVPGSSIRWAEPDGLGNLKGYDLRELRPDPEYAGPESQAPRVPYEETCRKDGEVVRFATFRSGSPYDWRVYPDGRHPGRMPAWEVPYGFVPLVLVQHIRVGLCWGWAECQPLLSRVRELDDLHAIIADQARRKLNNPLALNIPKPSARTDDRPRPAADEFAHDPRSALPGRDAQLVRYFGREGGQAIDLKGLPLAGDLSLADSDAHAGAILDAIYREYPELTVDLGDAAGDASGRSYRIRRQAAEAKVHERRTGYHDGLVRAQMMALSIGAGRGYEPYKALGPAGDFAAPYAAGRLDHGIGKTPVFAVDPLDDAELSLARGNALVAWTTGGLALETYLRHELNWPAAEVEQALDEAEDQAKAKADLAAQGVAAAADLAAKRLDGQDTGGNPPKPREMTELPPNRLDGAARANRNPSAAPNGVHN